MGLSRSRLTTQRIIALALVLISLPGIFVADVFLTEWRVPIMALYAIPVMVAAALFGTAIIVVVIVLAIGSSIVNATVTSLSYQTEVLSISALAIIGALSILWQNAQRRMAELLAERTRLHEQEQRRADALEDARARLMDFFAVVAHDLRNPVTTIGGYSQMLQRWDALPTEQRERLAGGLKSAVQQITRLANDLQDASRIGTDRFDLNRGQCDLVALVKQIAEERQVLSPSRQFILEACDERLTARCDRDRVLQAFGNLVENAIKYSPEGGEVRVTLERIGDHARAVVSDQGIGIAQEDIPRLFQPYERLQKTSGIKGLGLGLYIVKGIVEAHGGTVAVQSVLGQGSRFIIELPLEEEAGVRAVSEAADDESGGAITGDGHRQSERTARSAEQ